jgi:protocatechuate 3,4-dioxygenase alpha subunit
MTKLGQTPSQTVGPYFSMRLSREGENVLVRADTPGEHIRIEGTVLDGDRQHIEDALIEIWQANPGGRYRHPDDRRDIPIDDGFTGFGRVSSNFDTGEYWFETVKPGPVPDPEGELQAPHINVIIQGRGMLNPVFTRIYFSDEEVANRHDLILGMVAEKRRSSLIAPLVEGSKPKVYRFNIRFQGEDETVFFDF